MSFAHEVEKRIDQALRRWFAGPEGASAGRDALEVHRAILDDVVAHIRPLRRGQRDFPFNRLRITIAVTDLSQAPLWAAVFTEGQQLAVEIGTALREAECEPPANLQVEAQLTNEITPETAARGFHVAYQQAAPPPPQRLGAARLVVLQGEALPMTYDLTKPRTSLGRLADLLDEQQRLIRRNDVAFRDDAAGPNATVSRAHAHIRVDASSGEYRLFDDQSAYGTSLFRDGRLLPVPAGQGRGVRLQHGDEIYLGQARLRFEQPSLSDDTR